MQVSLTVKDALDFIRSTKKNFIDWSDEQVLRAINTALEQQTLAWHSSDGRTLDGIVIGQKENNNNVHIVTIYAKTNSIFRCFIEHFNKRFPGYALTGTRRGKKKEFTKLCKRYHS